MSKRINVNPDHYKVAGRERQGEAIVREPVPDSRPSDKGRQHWERVQKKKVKGRS
jgi:hypothetical protein